MELQSLGGPGAGRGAPLEAPALWLSSTRPTAWLAGATMLPMLTPKQKVRTTLAAVRRERGTAGDQGRPLPCRCRQWMHPHWAALFISTLRSAGAVSE